MDGFEQLTEEELEWAIELLTKVFGDELTSPDRLSAEPPHRRLKRYLQLDSGDFGPAESGQ